MNLTNEEIARAFSGHQFEAVYPFLTDDVAWTPVGGERLTGRDEVIGACEKSAAYLSNVTTEFRRFRAVVGENGVVIDSLAEYVDSEGERSLVASCDIYDFEDGKVSEITSYNIALNS